MRVLLDSLLPRLFPGLSFLCVPHEGKTDPERSIPRKLRRWREPGVLRFAVVRDNDGGNCCARHNRRHCSISFFSPSTSSYSASVRASR